MEATSVEILEYRAFKRWVAAMVMLFAAGSGSYLWYAQSREDHETRCIEAWARGVHPLHCEALVTR